MSDNSVQNGVDTIRDIDRAGVKTQIVLLDLGGTSAEALAGDSGVAMPVKGLAAHDAAVTGNPVRVAAYAKAAAPSDVSADADTVNLWALLNGALCAQLTAAGALIGGDASNGLDVDVTRVSGNVTVINAGTFAVQAAQAGTWNVGTVTGLTAITTSVTPGTSAAHLGKAEDAVHASGDTGVFVLAVRSDTAASTAGTDGDYTALITDSTGRLHCNVSNTLTVASHAVTNAGTFAVQATLAAGATAIAKAEDVASADADVGVPAMAVRKATPANTSGTDGDYEFLQISAGRLWASATIDAALPAGTNAIGKLAANTGVTIGAVEIAASQTLATVTTVSTVSTITNVVHVDDNSGSLTVDNGGTFAVQLAAGATAIGKAEDVASADADVGVPAMAVRKATPANTSGTDGDYEMLQISAGRLWCSATIDAALPAGTNAIGKLASNTGVTIGAVEIAAAQTLATVTTVGTVSTVTAVTTVSTVTTLTGSGVAHDAADSGNPHKIGVKAKSTLAGITAVSADDRTDLYGDIDGVLVTRDDCPAGDNVSGRATNTDGTSTECIAAQAAGVKTYLTDITLCNSSASNVTVDIKDGLTIKWTFPVPAGGGVVFSWKKPLAGTAATAWNFDPSAAATTVTCSMSGFKSKV